MARVRFVWINTPPYTIELNIYSRCTTIHKIHFHLSACVFIVAVEEVRYVLQLDLNRLLDSMAAGERESALHRRGNVIEA